MRADARRNLDALTDAAKAVFASDGVDAPAKVIADRAGVGVGTLYRHFPQRSDLVVAVFRNAVEDCADAAEDLAAGHAPDEALALWLQRFTEFVATKRGLAAALHSGDPAFEALPAYFIGRLGDALTRLLDAAAAAGTISADVDARGRGPVPRLAEPRAQPAHGRPARGRPALPRHRLTSAGRRRVQPLGSRRPHGVGHPLQQRGRQVPALPPERDVGPTTGCELDQGAPLQGVEALGLR
jgi:AcrR family transcriptional regulator